MTSNKKRFKPSSYTAADKIVFFSTISKFQNILGRKTVNHEIWKAKEEAWNEIVEEYNTVASVPRTVESLQKLLDYEKKIVKQKLAQKKNEVDKLDLTINDVMSFISLSLPEEKLIQEFVRIHADRKEQLLQLKQRLVNEKTELSDLKTKLIEQKIKQAKLKEDVDRLISLNINLLSPKRAIYVETGI